MDTLHRAGIGAVLVLVWAASLWAQGWVNPPSKAVQGFEHHTFHSAALNADVGYCVFLPPAYAEQAEARFPVVYFLHGMGGHESATLPAFQDMVGAMRNGKLRPTIYIFVNGGRASWYVNSPDGKVPAETIVSRELVDHVDGTYRTLARRESRGLMGFSMGGNGALMLALKYPEKYAAVMCYSPGLISGDEFRQFWESSFDAAYGGMDHYVAAHPLTLAEKNLDRTRGQVAVRIAIGDREAPVMVQAAQRAHESFVKLGLEHEFVLASGVGHSISRMFATEGLRGFEFLDAHLAR